MIKIFCVKIKLNYLNIKNKYQSYAKAILPCAVYNDVLTINAQLLWTKIFIN